MSQLGIYFGPKVISIVETKGKDVVNDIKVPLAGVAAGELEDKVPSDIKIATLLKETLRRNNIDAAETTLCLSGKDLIIRTFEIPVMPKEELQNAIIFEAKKYIPFKIEELILDSQLIFDRQSRTNLVLFMGIKKETLDKYFAILLQLNIKITAIEYSAFSQLRTIKLTGASENGIIGFISTDPQAEDEVNFTVLENGFPLFSRDISLGAGDEAAKPEEGASSLEKVKSELRVSLDYYKRKFPSKSINKLYMLTDFGSRQELEFFAQENNLSSQFIDISKFMARQAMFSSSFIKGYTASLAKSIKTGIKVNLLAPKARIKPLETAKLKPGFDQDATALFHGFRVEPWVIIIGLLICAATAGLTYYYKVMPLQRQVADIIDERPKVSSINPEAGYEELNTKQSEFKSRLDSLERIVNKQLFVTEPMNLIPKSMPEGVFLKSFSFNKGQESRADLNLEGFAYLADSSKEIDAINEFADNLKADAGFSKYFKDIIISSYDRGQYDNLSVTNFIINCKNQ